MLEKNNRRYVGITTSLYSRLAAHNAHQDFLGAGKKELIRSGSFTATYSEAVIEEVVVYIEESLLVGIENVRGGPFPGRRIFPQEVSEVSSLLTLYRVAGEEALRQKLQDIARGPCRGGVAAHVKIKCWDCSGFGHYRKSPVCPLVRRAAELALQRAAELADELQHAAELAELARQERKRKRQDAEIKRAEKKKRKLEAELQKRMQEIRAQEIRQKAAEKYAEGMQAKSRDFSEAHTPAIATLAKPPKLPTAKYTTCAGLSLSDTIYHCFPGSYMKSHGISGVRNTKKILMPGILESLLSAVLTPVLAIQYFFKSA